MSTNLKDTALLTNIEGDGLTALEANYHLNSGAGIIVFSDKRKLWYTDGKEKIKEKAYVRTWPNYVTWLDVASTSQ